MVYIDTTSICYQANTLRYRVVGKKVHRYEDGLRVDIDRYCSIYLTAGKCRHISAKRRDGNHQYNRQKRKAGGVEERGGGARRGGGEATVILNKSLICRREPCQAMATVTKTQKKT